MVPTFIKSKENCAGTLMFYTTRSTSLSGRNGSTESDSNSENKDNDDENSDEDDEV